eukprot:6299858-Pyramimonas_sp.AAC.1
MARATQDAQHDRGVLLNLVGHDVNAAVQAVDGHNHVHDLHLLGRVGRIPVLDQRAVLDARDPEHLPVQEGVHIDPDRLRR